jgi:hypothetical protein
MQFAIDRCDSMLNYKEMHARCRSRVMMQNALAIVGRRSIDRSVIVYADISAFEAGIDIGVVPGLILVARAASYVAARIAASTFLDEEWPRHRDETRRVGKQPVAYHYIGKTVSPAWQVEQTLQWIGAPPSEILITGGLRLRGQLVTARVTEEFVRRGTRCQWGMCPLVLLDRPQTTRSARFRIVVNSDYRTHIPDNSGGWAPLGPAAVDALQYTDRKRYGSYDVDMSTFRGTMEDLLSPLGRGGPDTVDRGHKILLLTIDPSRK